MRLDYTRDRFNVLNTNKSENLNWLMCFSSGADALQGARFHSHHFNTRYGFEMSSCEFSQLTPVSLPIFRALSWLFLSAACGPVLAQTPSPVQPDDAPGILHRLQERAGYFNKHAFNSLMHQLKGEKKHNFCAHQCFCFLSSSISSQGSQS